VQKQYRSLVPNQLIRAIDAHARAILAGDVKTAEQFASTAVLAGHRGALERTAAMHPFAHLEVIARARLGSQFIVKVRFDGAGGGSLTLQNRWREDDAHNWRIVEIDDLGVRSPWKKPTDAAPVNADG
jgi:hypothetical protein